MTVKLSINVARILDWGGAKPEITMVKTKKKESSQFDLGFVIEGGPKFSWRPILDWGGQTSS